MTDSTFAGGILSNTCKNDFRGVSGLVSADVCADNKNSLEPNNEEQNQYPEPLKSTSEQQQQQQDDNLDGRLARSKTTQQDANVCNFAPKVDSQPSGFHVTELQSERANENNVSANENQAEIIACETNTSNVNFLNNPLVPYTGVFSSIEASYLLLNTVTRTLRNVFAGCFGCQCFERRSPRKVETEQERAWFDCTQVSI